MAVTFPTTLDSFTSKMDNVHDVQAVDINDVQNAVEALETKVGVNSSAIEASLDYKVNTFLFDRKIWIYENIAPAGWNIVATTTDALLACKGGSNAYNANGGQQVGTWTITAHALPNHRHTTPASTHNHQVYDYVSTGSDLIYNSSGNPTGFSLQNKDNGQISIKAEVCVTGSSPVAPPDMYSSNAGPGASNTGYYQGSLTNNHGSTWRPLANLGIVIEKT